MGRGDNDTLTQSAPRRDGKAIQYLDGLHAQLHQQIQLYKSQSDRVGAQALNSLSAYLRDLPEPNQRAFLDAVLQTRLSGLVDGMPIAVNKEILKESLASQSEWLKKEHPQLLRGLGAKKYQQQILGQMMGVQIPQMNAQALTENEKAARVHHFVLASQIAEQMGELPPQLSERVTKLLNDLKQLAIEPSKELPASLRTRAEGISHLAALSCAKFDTIDHPDIVDVAKLVDQHLAPIKDKPVVAFADPSVLAHTIGMSGSGVYDSPGNFMLLSEKERYQSANGGDSDKEWEHMLLHELIHSRQEKLANDETALFSSIDNMQAYLDSVEPLSLEGLTETAAQYIDYGKVDLQQPTTYPALVVSFDSLSQVLDKDSQWMINTAQSASHIADVVESATGKSLSPAQRKLLPNALGDCNDYLSENMYQLLISRGKELATVVSFDEDEAEKVQLLKDDVTYQLSQLLRSWGVIS